MKESTAKQQSFFSYRFPIHVSEAWLIKKHRLKILSFHHLWGRRRRSRVQLQRKEDLNGSEDITKKKHQDQKKSMCRDNVWGNRDKAREQNGWRTSSTKAQNPETDATGGETIYWFRITLLVIFVNTKTRLCVSSCWFSSISLMSAQANRYGGNRRKPRSQSQNQLPQIRENTLFIGNLERRVTECACFLLVLVLILPPKFFFLYVCLCLFLPRYQVIKLFQPFGKIVREQVWRAAKKETTSFYC